MKKIITHGSGILEILLGGKRFTLKGNKGKLNKNYLAVSLLLTVVVLISIGCKKPGDNPTPPVVELATIVTEEVNAISQTTGASGGHIFGDGGASITARGICWSTTTNPTITNSKTTVGTDIWLFTSFATELAAGTTYYVRAYATNSAGTAYGNEISFTTLPVSANTVTDIDGNTYNTITIGTQVWMAENLKTTHYQNGDDILYGFSDGSWGSNAVGAYTIYLNSVINGDAVYGKLYNWLAVVDPRKIAPVGWHVPTETEWNTLASFLGGSNIAGVVMKEAGLTHWNSPNTGATNSSGFTGLPGGYRDTNGAYDFIGNGGWWWSTTETFAGSDEADALGLFTGSDEANIVTGKKNFGISVRCIKE